jgi:cell division protein FtsI (penicillin-binding protein 3)
VFTPIAQQVLEYLHTPHDVEIPANRQQLLARTKASDKDLEEGSPDHPGEAIEVADISPSDTLQPQKRPTGPANPEPVPPERDAHPPTIGTGIVPTALREKVSPPAEQATSGAPQTVSSSVPALSSGTVVLDVEQGGIVVPSFAGKSVRSAIELAESNGLDLDVVGSGVAQQQSPAAGAYVPSGARIVVKFGR